MLLCQRGYAFIDLRYLISQLDFFLHQQAVAITPIIYIWILLPMKTRKNSVQIFKPPEGHQLMLFSN
jgi:hypothetical protein